MRLYLKKIIRNFRDYGLSKTIKKILKQIVSPLFLYRKYRIYVADLETIKSLPIRSDDYKIRSIQFNEHHIIRQIESMEEWLAGQISAKIQDNNLCIVALDGDKMIGFNLISFNQVYIPLIEQKRELNHNEAWSDQISISKAYRGAGIGKIIRYNAFKELQGKGIKAFYGGTLCDNYPSLRLARSVGFQELVDVSFFKILGYRLWKNRKVAYENNKSN